MMGSATKFGHQAVVSPRPQRCGTWIGVFLFLVNLEAASPVIAAEAEPLALIQRHCLRCHTEEKRKGGLLLTSRESILAGGDSGPVAEPGHSGGSLIIETLFPESETHMPPKGQLSPAEIVSLEQWIDEGLPWDEATWERLNRSPLDSPISLTRIPDNYEPVFAMALDPSGETLLLGRGNQLEWLQVPQGEVETEAAEKSPSPALRSEAGPETVQSIAWSPDGRWVAVGSFRRVSFWDSKSRTLRGEIQAPLGGRISALAFSPDSETLIAADSTDAFEGKLHWIDPETMKITHSLTAHDDAIFDIAASPDGSMIATASADKSIRLWSKTEDQPIRILEGHTGYVLAAAFSPGNDRLASAGDDEEIKIWQIDTGKKIASFGGSRTGPITALTWVEDPTNLKKKTEEKDPEKAKAINTDRIVAINEQGQPRIYTELNEHEGAQRSTGAREKSIEAAECELSSLAYDPNTHRFFAGSPEGALLEWDPAGKLSIRQTSSNTDVPQNTESQ